MECQGSLYNKHWPIFIIGFGLVCKAVSSMVKATEVLNERFINYPLPVLFCSRHTDGSHHPQTEKEPQGHLLGLQHGYFLQQSQVQGDCQRMGERVSGGVESKNGLSRIRNIM